jgi:hypothetical protein
MALSYYIYYRVDSGKIATATQRTRDLLDVVRTQTGVSGRLLKKHGEPRLWMEVFENITNSDEFERTLEGAVKGLNAVEFLQSGTGRHVECFEE